MIPANSSGRPIVEVAMSINLPRHLRPILAGLVVLVLSGGAAFAGQPTDVPVDGRAVAAERSGLDIPPGNQAPTVDDEDDPDVEVDEDAPDEDAEVDEAVDGEGDHCVDPGTLTPDVLAETNHGAIVCWAAQQETPEGYDNHGQWVSEWAKDNHGQGLKGSASRKGHGKPD
jgi:hypothetical protein